MSIGIYGVSIDHYRTNYDTQGQDLLSSFEAHMEPVGMPGILQNPLGPSSSEYPTFVTLYNVYADGPLINTDITMPVVGDEMVVTALMAATSLLAGRWRVVAEPEFYSGGTASTELDHFVFKVLRVTP
jgi:hypothetical protein